MTKTKSAAKKSPGSYKAIVGHGPWGLAYGDVTHVEVEHWRMKGGGLRVKNYRNIRYWYGPKGGISSLAALGPDPLDERNRIGAEAPETVVVEVKAVHRCSPAAVSRFAATGAPK